MLSRSKKIKTAGRDFASFFTLQTSSGKEIILAEEKQQKIFSILNCCLFSVSFIPDVLAEIISLADIGDEVINAKFIFTKDLHLPRVGIEDLSHKIQFASLVTLCIHVIRTLVLQTDRVGNPANNTILIGRNSEQALSSLQNKRNAAISTFFELIEKGADFDTCIARDDLPYNYSAFEEVLLLSFSSTGKLMLRRILQGSKLPLLDKAFPYRDINDAFTGVHFYPIHSVVFVAQDGNLLKLLLEKKPNLSVRTFTDNELKNPFPAEKRLGITPVAAAMSTGRCDLVKLLVEVGGAEFHENVLFYKNPDSYSELNNYLLLVIAFSNIELVEYCLNTGKFSPNFSLTFETPFLFALSQNNLPVRIIQLLMQHDADLHTTKVQKYLPYILALHPNLAIVLKVPELSNQERLFHLVYARDLDIIEISPEKMLQDISFLLGNGANPAFFNEESAPLFQAAFCLTKTKEMGKKQIIKYRIDVLEKLIKALQKSDIDFLNSRLPRGFLLEFAHACDFDLAAMKIIFSQPNIDLNYGMPKLISACIALQKQELFEILLGLKVAIDHVAEMRIASETEQNVLSFSVPFAEVKTLGFSSLTARVPIGALAVAFFTANEYAIKHLLQFTNLSEKEGVTLVVYALHCAENRKEIVKRILQYCDFKNWQHFPVIVSRNGNVELPAFKCILHINGKITYYKQREISTITEVTSCEKTAEYSSITEEMATASRTYLIKELNFTPQIVDELLKGNAAKRKEKQEVKKKVKVGDSLSCTLWAGNAKVEEKTEILPTWFNGIITTKTSGVECPRKDMSGSCHYFMRNYVLCLDKLPELIYKKLSAKSDLAFGDSWLCLKQLFLPEPKIIKVSLRGELFTAKITHEINVGKDARIYCISLNADKGGGEFIIPAFVGKAVGLEHNNPADEYLEKFTHETLVLDALFPDFSVKNSY